MGEHLVVDAETNDPGDFRTLEDLREVFCLVVARADGGEPEAYYDGPAELPNHRRMGSVATGVARCARAERLIGHNVLGFDLPVFERLYPGAPRVARRRVVDTQVLSRLAWTDLRARDHQVRKIPQHLAGSHSLEAWGLRLGLEKDVAFRAREDAWERLTPELVAYCARDVEVTRELYRHFLRQPLDPRSVRLEHDFADVVYRMMARGARFDLAAAERLIDELGGRRFALETELAGLVAPFVDRYQTEVKKLERERVTPFNPRSRAHIVRHLRERRGWRPRAFTPTGQPKMDEAVLGSLDWPETRLLSRHVELTKTLGYLADGKHAWTKLVKPTGRIHGDVYHQGTVTSRCAHRKPNLGNVPKTGELGHACRSLFVASPGRLLVGADASGLEMRGLGNRLAEWDDGAFGRALDEGDVHSDTAAVIGLSTEQAAALGYDSPREHAKRVMYALLYGAGDGKLGRLVGGSKADGAALRSRLLQGVRGLEAFTRRCGAGHEERGALVGLDGRRIPTRSEHAALNSQLQADGAVVMKQAVVNMDRALADRAWAQVLMVHDEVQAESAPDEAEENGRLMAAAIEKAGEDLGLRVPLRAEYKVGASWAETH